MTTPNHPMTAEVMPPADGTEGGGWTLQLPGVPVHGEGEIFDDAVTNLIAALRQYAKDWNENLSEDPAHAENQATVKLVDRVTDDGLRTWLGEPGLAQIRRLNP